MADEQPPWAHDLHDGPADATRKLADGLHTRLFTGENSMLSVVTIEPNSEGAIHSHPEEQWGILIEGSCIRIQGGEEYVAEPGDFWHTPGGVEHGVRTGDEGALVLDVFSPPRPEYRSSGEGFGTD